MPRYEHWHDDGDDSEAVIGEGTAGSHPFVGPARLCCVIEAETWEEAMRTYHDHMGWTPYQPMHSSDATDAPGVG